MRLNAFRDYTVVIQQPRAEAASLLASQLALAR
jgi:hypothetical protein